MTKKDLIPLTKRTEKERKEIAKKGGIASGIAKREKKLISQIYAEFMMKEHDIIEKDGTIKKLSGQALVNEVMSKVLSRGDSSSVSMLKEVREGTEGNKIDIRMIDKSSEKLEEIKSITTKSCKITGYYP